MTFEIDDAKSWTFHYVPHINGMVITEGGGFINAGPSPKFVVKGSKTLDDNITFGVFGYGQTDLEAMQNAIDRARETEKRFATPHRP